MCVSPSASVALDSHAVDQRGRERRAETVVDIDDGDAARARIQHPEQRGQPTHRSAVTNAGRHRDHGLVDQSGDHGRQCALHSRDDDQHARLANRVEVGSQPMNTRDADVVHSRDAISEQLRTERGFFGDGNVGSARAHHHHDALSRRLDAFFNDYTDARIGMICERANFAFDHARLVRVEPRDYQIRSRRKHALSDRYELIGSLALAENYFRNSAADAPMIVELGESKILEWQLANMLEGRTGGHPARGHTVEDFTNSFLGHRRLRSSGRIGRASVSISSRTARASLRVTVIVNSSSINFSPGFGICPSRSTTRPPIVAYSSASESLRPK